MNVLRTYDKNLDLRLQRDNDALQSVGKAYRESNIQGYFTSSFQG